MNEGRMSSDYVIIAFFSSPLCLKMATPGLPVDLELKKVSNKLTITIGWGLCESRCIYQIPLEMDRQLFETFLYAFEGAHAKLFSSNSQFFSTHFISFIIIIHFKIFLFTHRGNGVIFTLVIIIIYSIFILTNFLILIFILDFLCNWIIVVQKLGLGLGRFWRMLNWTVTYFP